MRKALLYGPEDVRVEDVPEPQPAAGQIRIRVAKSAIYGTDLKFYRGIHVVPYPSGLGADFVGVVDALGPGVTSFAVGDRVVASDMPHCGSCRMCATGRTNLCVNIKDPMQHRAECFQEATLAEATRAAKIPDSVSDDDGATMAALNMSLNVFEMADIASETRVLVIGVGAMGAGAIQVAASLGHQVVAVHKNASRLKMARDLGADHAIIYDAVELELREIWPDGPQCVVDAAGTEATAAKAIELAGLGGSVVLLGTGQWGIPSRPIAHKELHVTSVRGGHHQAAAVRLVAEGKLGLGRTIGRTFPLSEAAEALRYAATDRSHIRVGLDHSR